MIFELSGGWYIGIILCWIFWKFELLINYDCDRIVWNDLVILCNVFLVKCYRVIRVESSVIIRMGKIMISMRNDMIFIRICEVEEEWSWSFGYIDRIYECMLKMISVVI